MVDDATGQKDTSKIGRFAVAQAAGEEVVAYDQAQLYGPLGQRGRHQGIVVLVGEAGGVMQ